MNVPALTSLEELSLHALVAFAVRCARRASHLLIAQKGVPDEAYAKVVEDGLKAVETVIGGRPFNSHALWLAGQRALETTTRLRQSSTNATTVAKAVALAVDAAYQAFVERIQTKDLQGNPPLLREHHREVVLIVRATYTAAGKLDGISDEPLDDLQKLLNLQQGQSPGDGTPIHDVSENGPLGPLMKASQ